MDDITVDRQTLKALGADTRVNILKALGERRKTQAELAHELRLSEAAVSEHLERLSEANLVQRAESASKSSKWKYYELTPKGNGIIRPSNVRVWFALAITILAFVASTNQVYFSLSNPAVGFGSGGALVDTFVPSAASAYASSSSPFENPNPALTGGLGSTGADATGGMAAAAAPMAQKTAAPQTNGGPSDVTPAAQTSALTASTRASTVAAPAPNPLTEVDAPAVALMLLSLVGIGICLGILLDRRAAVR